MTFSDYLSLAIVGALAGSFAGMLLARKKEGLGKAGNFGLGLLGAVLGGAIVRIFKIDFGWGQVVIRFEDLAFGAVCCVGIFIGFRYWRKGRDASRIND